MCVIVHVLHGSAGSRSFFRPLSCSWYDERTTERELSHRQEAGSSESPPYLDSVISAESHDADEYDDRAAKLWPVYVDKAESHDNALIEA
jgi:hypothetical protein